MSQPLVDIQNLNLNRYGKHFDKEVFIATFNEELKEMLNALDTEDEYEFIDGANDLMVVLAGAITKKGYNPQLTLKQTVKEITSREQDPTQKSEWSKDQDKVGTEKWKKNMSQPESSKYKANYNLCKLGK